MRLLNNVYPKKAAKNTTFKLKFMAFDFILNEHGN